MGGAENQKTRLIANRYAVEAALGTGGMGAVYLARDTFLQDSKVAIKLLHRNLTRNPEFVQRFLREMQTLRQVQNGNVVRIFDTGEYNGEYFYTMEYLEGRSLADLLDKLPAPKQLPWDRLTSILYQILRGLKAVHDTNLVHRDLKPDNMLLVGNDTVKLTDFGIVRTTDSNLTETEAILGTFHYIAPEIWSGKAPTFQTDIYALGVVFYELLTGEIPFPGDSPAKVMKLHLTKVAPPVSNYRSDLPFWVDILLQKMLAKSADERPKSVDVILRLFETAPKHNASATDNKVPEKVAKKSRLKAAKAASLTAPPSEPAPSPAPTVAPTQVTSSSQTNAVRPEPRRTEAASRSSYQNHTVPRLELDSPNQTRKTVTTRRSLRFGRPKTFKVFLPTSKAMRSVVAVLGILSVMAFPRSADWVEMQVSRINPLQVKKDADELGCVEHFVAAYYNNRSAPEKLVGSYEIFQRELSVLVPEGDNSFKDLPLPGTEELLLLSGKSTQIAIAPVKPNAPKRSK